METDPRVQRCKALGFDSAFKLHETIAAGAKHDASWLKQKKLNAENLLALGYLPSGMRKLGYDDATLAALGYPIKAAQPAIPRTSDADAATEAKALIAKGFHANELKQAGFAARECRVAGVSAREMQRLGFSLQDLLAEFSASELRHIGFKARELARFLGGSQLKGIGFTARDMRCDGYTIKELLRFGYGENEIIGAGFGTQELIQAGLSSHTTDKTRLRRS